MRLGARPELDDEHGIRLVVIRTDLIGQATQLCQHRIAPAELGDEFITLPRAGSERAGIDENHAFRIFLCAFRCLLPRP